MEDQRDYPSYHQSDYPKMIDQQEDFQEEDSLEVEDSQVEEYLEEVEDTPEEEAHWEQDRQEEDGDHHPFQYLNHKQENWSEKHPQFMMETGKTRNSSSINGSCTGG